MTTEQMLHALSESGNASCRNLALKIISEQTSVDQERHYTGTFMSAVLAGDFPKAIRSADIFNWTALLSYVRKHPAKVLNNGTHFHLLDYLGELYEDSKDGLATGFTPGSAKHDALTFNLKAMRDLGAIFLQAARPTFSSLVRYDVVDNMGVVLADFSTTIYYLDGRLVSSGLIGIDDVNTIFARLSQSHKRLQYSFREIEAEQYLEIGTPPDDLKTLEDKLAQL